MIAWHFQEHNPKISCQLIDHKLRFHVWNSWLNTFIKSSTRAQKSFALCHHRDQNCITIKTFRNFNSIALRSRRYYACIYHGHGSLVDIHHTHYKAQQCTCLVFCLRVQVTLLSSNIEDPNLMSSIDADWVVIGKPS